MDDQQAKAARVTAAMKEAALIVLVERVGARFTFTEAEYDAVVARHGGKTRLWVAVEVSKSSASGERSVEIRLEEKAPRNAELMS